MEWEIIFVFGLLVATLVTFVWEKFPTDLTAMSAFAILMGVSAFTGSERLPTTQESLTVFAEGAPLTIAFMFILSAALERCGAIDQLARILKPIARLGYTPFLFVLVFIVGALSAFVNNTPVVVVLLPVIMTLSKEIGVVPSKLLIPLSYASIFGGTCSLMGTSTNILASSIMESSGLDPLSMFEIGRVGLPLLFAGAIYLVVVGKKLLPKREMLTSILSDDERREYITEAFIPRWSNLDGVSIADSGLLRKRGMRLLEVIRHGIAEKTSNKNFVLEGGDRLILAVRPTGVAEARDIKGMELFADAESGVEEIASDEGSIVEGVIAPNSSVVGKTVREINFRQRFRMVVMAVHRHGQNVREKIDTLPLAFGDTLLMMGTDQAIENLRRSEDILLLDKPRVPNQSSAGYLPWVIGTVIAVVALATFNVLPIVLSTLIGCCVLLLSGVIDPKDGYKAIDWSILALIFGMLGIGQAMETSGATALISDWITAMDMHPWLLLFVVYAITSIFTETLSNNATVVVMAPLAIAIAEGIGVDPRPFLIATCVASSASFSTPIGYQTNTYVYSVGGYRFSDFAKVGIPLNLLYLVVTCSLVPLFWPFNP